MWWIAVVIIVIFCLILIVASATIKVVTEYERGVVFRLGRLMGPRGPGVILLMPFVERMMKVDLRIVTMDIPVQEVITRDNVTIRVNAVAYFRVMDPNAATVNIADYRKATSQIAQTTLRSVLGQAELDELLSEREKINHELQAIIDEQTEPWGIKVSIVEVKDVELPNSMQRAMARQAEAEREKRAKIIHASGEYEASKQLADAARVISSEPGAMQLRYIQTLADIAVEQNSTVIFPLPLDLIKPLMGFIDKLDDAANRDKPPEREAPDGKPESPEMIEESNQMLGKLLEPHSPRASETMERALHDRADGDKEETEE